MASSESVSKQNVMLMSVSHHGGLLADTERASRVPVAVDDNRGVAQLHSMATATLRSVTPAQAATASSSRSAEQATLPLPCRRHRSLGATRP